MSKKLFQRLNEEIKIKKMKDAEISEKELQEAEKKVVFEDFVKDEYKNLNLAE